MLLQQTCGGMLNRVYLLGPANFLTLPPSPLGCHGRWSMGKRQSSQAPPMIDVWSSMSGRRVDAGWSEVVWARLDE